MRQSKLELGRFGSAIKKTGISHYTRFGMHKPFLYDIVVSRISPLGIGCDSSRDERYRYAPILAGVIVLNSELLCYRYGNARFSSVLLIL